MSHPDPAPLLHRHFADQARRTPDRTALREGDRTVSLVELKDRASGSVTLKAMTQEAEGLLGSLIDRGADSQYLRRG